MPWAVLSLDSPQKRFLWTHKEIDLVPHSVIGLVLQVGDAEKFPYAFGFESLDPIFRVSNQGPVSADINTCSCRRSRFHVSNVTVRFLHTQVRYRLAAVS